MKRFFSPILLFGLISFLIINPANIQLASLKILSLDRVAQSTPEAKLSEKLVQEIRSQKKEGDPKLDTALNSLVQRLQSTKEKYQPEMKLNAEKEGFRIKKDLVLVTFTMEDTRMADQLVLEIPELGGEVTARFEQWVDAYIPLTKIEEASGQPGVRFMQRSVIIEDPPEELTPIEPMPLLTDAALSNLIPATGSVVTQGVARANAQAWHAVGLKGQNVRIAILDHFQYLGNAQSAGEFANNVIAYPSVAEISFASTHGTNVAEILYDMAPAATYTISSLPEDINTCTGMAQRIVDLANIGNQIISSSVGPVYCEAGDGNIDYDLISRASYIALNQYHTMFLNAAGNNANAHWDGAFRDLDNDGIMDYSSNVNINIIPAVPALSSIQVFLRWNGWPVTNQDYDLYLYRYDVTGWVLVQRSTNTQNGSQPPKEDLFYTTGNYTADYGVVVYQYSANGAQNLRMATFGKSLTQKVKARSLIDPASSPYVYSVAAVDVNSLVLEDYSSQGPTYGAGGALTGGSSQPQISGFANVDTWIGKVTNSPKFNGTSSATPHVAGAAALVWGANPCLSPIQVGTFLKDRSIDRGASGYDYQYGRGVLYLGPPTNTLCTSPVSLDERLFIPVVRK